MPKAIQKIAVNFLVFILYYLYLSTGKKLDKKTLQVDMYDSITPRWRHYHTPEEISRWYFAVGFGPITLSHWDNRYGFGAFAIKLPMLKTPGENF